MPRKSKKPVRKQTDSPTVKVVGQVSQILLPMIAGIAATKADLTEWVYEQGLTALHLLLREDAEEIAGPKGKHEKERTHNHWGSTNGELSFGGRRIQVSRPRVRSKSGEEASLPHFKAFREEDPLPERVLNQILVGVSTRNYESSLDKPAAKLKSRGTSKSAASRHLVSQTTKKLEQYLSRRLEEYELAALMMDGLEVAVFRFSWNMTVLKLKYAHGKRSCHEQRSSSSHCGAKGRAVAPARCREKAGLGGMQRGRNPAEPVLHMAKGAIGWSPYGVFVPSCAEP